MAQPGEKKLTVKIDGGTYKRLRFHSARTGQTHQTILEAALVDLLDKQDAN